MSKKSDKSKRSHKPTQSKQSKKDSSSSKTMRNVIIGVVVIIVIIVLLLRCSPAPAPDDWAASRVATSEPTAALESTEIPAAAVPTAVSESTPLPTATPVPDTTVSDPFPEDASDQLDWALRNKKPSFIFFHSTTCAPCKAMMKVLERVLPDYEGKIVYVDVLTDDKANAGLSREAGIRAVPTSFFLTGEGKGKRRVGGMDEPAIREALDSLLTEDVE